MKYQHHQGTLQHTLIHKQQEQTEVTDFFFLNPPASTLIKFLMPHCWLKLSTESKSDEHHLSPNRKRLKDVKWNVKQVKYKKIKMLMHNARSEIPSDPRESRRCKSFRSHTTGDSGRCRAWSGRGQTPSCSLIRTPDPRSLPAPTAREN